MSDKPISFRLTPSLVERLRDFAQPEELDESGETRVNLIAKRLLCEMLGESTEVSTGKPQVSTSSRVVDSNVDNTVNNVDISILSSKLEEKLTAQLTSAIEQLREEFAGELHA